MYKLNTILGAVIALALGIRTASAQSIITPDTTLGTEASLVNSLDPNLPIDIINGGAIRGNNLFHSFSQFNVGANRGVYFFSPSTNIVNILARVTGGSRSEILGTLGTLGSSQPNLFLINPNGIIFGQNATLDVGKSFVATTADTIQFGNQGFFSATNPQAPALLTVNPSALLFNQINNGTIINQSQAPAGLSPTGQQVTGLRVQDGNNLLLVGGNINIDGGAIRAYSGNIELAGLETGNIQLDIVDGNPQLILPEVVARADISLSNGAEVNVRGSGGGNINIYGRNVNLTEESKLRAGIDTGLGTPDTKGGDIVINATGTTTLTDNSFIANVLIEQAYGKAGDVNITTESLILNNGSINTSIYGYGSAGSIAIKASDVSFINGSLLYSNVNTGALGNGGSINIKADSLVSLKFSDIFSTVETGAIGNGGDINIKAGSFELRDGAQIQTLVRESDGIITPGQGNAGNVNIDVEGAVKLGGQKDGFNSGISSGLRTGAVGNGGNITIKSSSLSLTGSSALNTSAAGRGNAGNININVEGAVQLGNDKDGSSGILSDLRTGAVGNGGNITIKSGSLSLASGFLLSAETNGQGNAGNITINARDFVTLDGGESDGKTNISNGVKAQGVGKAGEIQITAGSLQLINGALIGNTSAGKGDAGNITLDIKDAVTLADRSLISNALFSGGEGKAGQVNISAASLSMTNRSAIFNDTYAQGDASGVTINVEGAAKLDSSRIGSSVVASETVGRGGDIRFRAGVLSLINDSGIGSFSYGQGDAGNMFITTDSLLINNASIITSLGGQGKAGNIQIDTRSLLLQGENANIQSNLFGVGKGGNITINTETLSLKNALGIASATNGKGNAGNITVNASNSIFALNSEIFSGVASNGQGNAGDISIRTGSLSFFNGARLDTNTSGRGNAGNINIIARDAVSFTGANSNGRVSGASSQVESIGVGKGGDIEISTNSLFLTDGAQLNAATGGQGDAGNITVNATGAVTLDGLSNNGYRSGIFTIVENGSTGIGGDININASTLSISNNAGLSASGFGKGNAGDININTRSVRLDNRGIIGAVTNSSDGGNINLTATDLLLLRRGSAISTTAGFAEAGGNGGNITINTPFIIALLNENSDITANAFTGRGGNVNINVQSIFGIEARASETLNSDITASSQRGVQGQININQPEVQPTQGIIELPGEVVDASNQIGQMCPRGGYARRPLGEFTNTGRGSLPPSPLEPLPGIASLSTLATLDNESTNVKPTQISRDGATKATSTNQIIEAQGWVKTANGDVELVAMAPNVVPSGRQTVNSCS